MSAPRPIAVPAFDAPRIADLLERLSPEEADALDFGLIAIDHDGRVVVYNRFEAERAGLSPGRVLGRHLFGEVAPCMDVPDIGGVLSGGAADVTRPFTFAFRMRLTPVTLRLVCADGGQRRFVLVRPREG